MSMLLEGDLQRGKGTEMPKTTNGPATGMSLTREERAAAQRVLLMLEELKRQRSSMTVSVAIALMHVAINEGASVQELSTNAGVAQSVMSRHLLDLGPHTRSKEPGAGLVQHQMSATNMRSHELRLTTKGVTLLKKLVRMCGGAH